jgi:hypothetical protein
MRPAIAVLLIALCAACAGGCGGDSSESTTAPDGTASTGSEASGPANGAAPGQDGSTNDSNGDEASQDDSSSGATSEGGDSSEGAPGGRSRHPKADLPHRGQVSANSAPFQKYSAKGKLHLAEFGEEASGGDFGEAETVVEDYLQAFGAQKWGVACEYLLTEVKAQIVTMVKGAKGSVEGCDEALEPWSKSPLGRGSGDGSPIYAPEGISSLRIQKGGLSGDGAGFALFRGSDGTDHWLAMKVEDGKWKLLSASPQLFR